MCVALAGPGPCSVVPACPAARFASWCACCALHAAQSEEFYALLGRLRTYAAQHHRDHWVLVGGCLWVVGWVGWLCATDLHPRMPCRCRPMCPFSRWALLTRAACLPARPPARPPAYPDLFAPPSCSAPPAASGASSISRPPSRLTATASGAAACSGACLPACLPARVPSFFFFPPVTAPYSFALGQASSPCLQPAKWFSLSHLPSHPTHPIHPMPAGPPSPAARRRCPKMSRWGGTTQLAASTGRARETNMTIRRRRIPIVWVAQRRGEVLHCRWGSTHRQQLGHCWAQ